LRSYYRERYERIPPLLRGMVQNIWETFVEYNTLFEVIIGPCRRPILQKDGNWVFYKVRNSSFAQIS